MDILLILAGGLAIAAGILGKTFYEADVIALGTFKSKEETPTWSGRVLFISVGAALIAIGMRLLWDAR
jgi:hypothetical protein